MRKFYKKIQVHCPVEKAGIKKPSKIVCERFRKARAVAVAVVDEISGLSPLEKKVTSLIEAKIFNKAKKLLSKRLGSRKRATVKLEKLMKMSMEE